MPPQLEPHGFQLLSDEEFWALSTEERLEYLGRAVQQRSAINRQIDAALFRATAPDKK